MGCSDSKGLKARETIINNKNAQQNLSKYEESKVEQKNSTKNNVILTENNIIKDDTNKEHKNNKYKDKINLIYYANFNAIFDIFGEMFVKNNKDNIYLIINGQQNELVNKFRLNQRVNNITIVIKNKLTNLSKMFNGFNLLIDFE